RPPADRARRARLAGPRAGGARDDADRGRGARPDGGRLALLRRGVGRDRRARDRGGARHGVARHHRRGGPPPSRRPAVERRATPARGPRDRERRTPGRAACEGESGVGRCRALIVVAALWAATAHAGGACDEGRGATGLALALRAGVLTV